jgi:hypothetical protein
MKTSLLLARTVAGFAALFVNQSVVMETSSSTELATLEDTAKKLRAALGVDVVTHMLKPGETCWSKGWSESSGGAPNWSDLASHLEAAPEQPDTVPVRICDAYEPEDGIVKNNTHSFEVSDRRQFDGQARLMVSAQEHPEDLLDVLLEVQASPFNAAFHVPVAHVHVDMDDPVVSIFKLDDTLLIRPNTGVDLRHEVVVIDGKPEDVIIVAEA